MPQISAVIPNLLFSSSILEIDPWPIFGGKLTSCVVAIQMKHNDMEEASQMCTYLQDLSVIDMKEEGLKQIGDINLNISLKPEQWTRILEQVSIHDNLFLNLGQALYLLAKDSKPRHLIILDI